MALIRCEMLPNLITSSSNQWRPQVLCSTNYVHVPFLINRYYTCFMLSHNGNTAIKNTENSKPLMTTFAMFLSILVRKMKSTSLLHEVTFLFSPPQKMLRISFAASFMLQYSFTLSLTLSVKGTRSPYSSSSEISSSILESSSSVFPTLA